MHVSTSTRFRVYEHDIHVSAPCELSGTRIFVGENTFLVQRQFNPFAAARPSRRHLEAGSSVRGTFMEAMDPKYSLYARK